jgi:hypothetical protein
MTRQDDNQARRHIREADEAARQFVLHPENDELFTRTGRQVIEACRLSISIEVWLEETAAMFDHVSAWIDREGLGERVASVYATGRGASICLFFVVSGERYDFELADKLAILTRELVRGFNIGPVEVHQLPWAELEQFVTLEDARAIYGGADHSHQTVET